MRYDVKCKHYKCEKYDKVIEIKCKHYELENKGCEECGNKLYQVYSAPSIKTSDGYKG